MSDRDLFIGEGPGAAQKRVEAAMESGRKLAAEVVRNICTENDRLEAALRESQARVEELNDLARDRGTDLMHARNREAALTQALSNLADTTGWLMQTQHQHPEMFDRHRQARAALASPSDAAAKLLERVETAESTLERWKEARSVTPDVDRLMGAQRDEWAKEHIRALVDQAGREAEEREAREHFSHLAQQKWSELTSAEADRDRWLGHVRALVPLLHRWAPVLVDSTEWAPVVAARLDLEQHDAGRGR